MTVSDNLSEARSRSASPNSPQVNDDDAPNEACNENVEKKFDQNGDDNQSIHSRSRSRSRSHSRSRSKSGSRSPSRPVSEARSRSGSRASRNQVAVEADQEATTVAVGVDLVQSHHHGRVRALVHIQAVDMVSGCSFAFFVGLTHRN